MSSPDHQQTLHRYLRLGRDALRWKLEGLSELEARRPLTPTGLNLLGLNRHVAVCAAEYFGVTFARPFPGPLPDVETDPHADFVVPATVSLAEALEHNDRAWAHADATIETLDLDAPGRVPWWPPETAEVTLQQILVHMIADTHRHAGHADILREQLDGASGLRPDSTNLPEGTDWPDHVAHVAGVAEQAARRF